MNAHDVPDLAYGDAPDAFDSANGRTYSGPVTAATPGQAPLSPAFARWYRIGLPLAADDVLAAAWVYQHEAERTFWAQVDAAQDARPAPECNDECCDPNLPPEPEPAPTLAAEGASPDVRPRSDDRRGLDITCGKCGEDYGTNVPDLDQIECPECGARRCPQCRAWHGGDKW